jgi:hypothetical protein
MVQHILEASPIAEFVQRFGVARILDLLSPYYADARPLLQRELQMCTDAYFASGTGNELYGFFMVGTTPPRNALVLKNCIYLGLSARSVSAPESFRGLMLYEYFKTAAKRPSRLPKDEPILWWTTASPIVLAAGQSLFRSLAPNEDGRVPESYVAIVEGIRKFYFSHVPPHVPGGESPAVIRHAVSDTSYNACSTQVLNGYRQKRGPTLLDELGIVEPQGDRLLVLSALD